MPMFQFLLPTVTDPSRFANVTSRLFTTRECLCFKSITMQFPSPYDQGVSGSGDPQIVSGLRRLRLGLDQYYGASVQKPRPQHAAPNVLFMLRKQANSRGKRAFDNQVIRMRRAHPVRGRVVF